MQTIPIIKNETYENVVSGGSERFEHFLFPAVEDIDREDANNLTRDVCILLKGKDSDLFANYALDTKVAGGSRSRRIPLLRTSKKSTSLWKFVNRLEKVDKAVAELNDLLYFIENNENLIKVLVVADLEGKRSINNKNNNEYIKQIVKDNNLIWISYDYLKDVILKSNSCIDLEGYLFMPGKVYIK